MKATKKTRVDTDTVLLFLKQFSDKLIPLLAKTSITPNQVSSINFLIFSPLSAYFFFKGGLINNFLALGALFVHSFFDLIDGELARQTKQLTRVGGWLEEGFDNLLQFIIIISLSLHVLTNFSGIWMLLGILPIIGQSLANSYGLRLFYQFSIDPLTGNEAFNSILKKRLTFSDRFLFNMVVPSETPFIMLFTLRYYIFAGVITNKMPLFFLIFGFMITLRAIMLLVIITFSYCDYSFVHKSKVLSYLSETSKK